MPRPLKRFVFAIVASLITLKFRIFSFYYEGLGVQARYLYRQSDLFKNRWQMVGLDYAEQSFDHDAMHFFRKAREEHILIRAKIFWDGLLGRVPQPYYLGQ